MTQGPVQAPGVPHLMGRAAIYKLLACAFSFPNDESFAQLRALLRDVRECWTGDDVDVAEALTALSENVRGQEPRQLASFYTRLFAAETKSSLRETDYDRNAFAKASQLADISGLYGAFGLRPSNSVMRAPARARIEFEFLSFLLLKQVHALARCLPQEVEIAHAAYRSFLCDHAGRWISSFTQCLGVETNPTGFYRVAISLAEAFVERELVYEGVAPRPSELDVAIWGGW